MKKISTFVAAATLAIPSFVQAGGLDPVPPVQIPAPTVENTGSLGPATPWIIAGVAIAIIALASSDNDDDAGNLE